MRTCMVSIDVLVVRERILIEKESLICVLGEVQSLKWAYPAQISVPNSNIT